MPARLQAGPGPAPVTQQAPPCRAESNLSRRPHGQTSEEPTGAEAGPVGKGALLAASARLDTGERPTPSTGITATLGTSGVPHSCLALNSGFTSRPRRSGCFWVRLELESQKFLEEPVIPSPGISRAHAGARRCARESCRPGTTSPHCPRRGACLASPGVAATSPGLPAPWCAGRVRPARQGCEEPALRAWKLRLDGAHQLSARDADQAHGTCLGLGPSLKGAPGALSQPWAGATPPPFRKWDAGVGAGRPQLRPLAKQLRTAENLPLAWPWPSRHSHGAAATFLVTFSLYCQVQIYKEVPVFISTLVFSTHET